MTDKAHVTVCELNAEAKAAYEAREAEEAKKQAAAEAACPGHEWYPDEGHAFYCCHCGAYREADDAMSGFGAQERADRLQAEVETLKAELAAMRAQVEALKVALGESNDQGAANAREAYAAGLNLEERME